MWQECIIQEHTLSIVNITQSAFVTADGFLLVGNMTNINAMERKSTIFSRLFLKHSDPKLNLEYKYFSLFFSGFSLNSRRDHFFFSFSPSLTLDTYHLECIFIICPVNTLTFEEFFIFPLALQYDF